MIVRGRVIQLEEQRFRLGLEYPAAGIQRNLVEQARDALLALVDSGELTGRGG